MADSVQCRDGRCNCISYNHETLQKCQMLLHITFNKVKMKRTLNLQKTVALKQLMKELIKYAKENQNK